MKFLKMLAWLALAGILLLPACTTSKTASPSGDTRSQAAATTPAPTGVSRAAVSRTPTPVPTEEAAYPAPEQGAASVEPAPDSAYPAPAGETAASEAPSETLPPAAYPAPSVELPVVSPASQSSQSNTPYPAPGGSQSGPPPVPTNSQLPSTETALPTVSPAGSSTPLPTRTQQNPAATEPSNPRTYSPYPGPVQPTEAGPAGQSSPSATTMAPNTPRTTSTAPAQRTPTSQLSNVTPGPTGTLTPTPPQVVRVALKATDPSTVRLDSGQLQLVEFFAFWSPLCKSMAPVVHLLEDQYNGRIQFTYLDVDNRANDRFKKALGYQFAPHIFLLDSQGEILKQWKGYVRSEDLKAEFAAQGVAP